MNEIKTDDPLQAFPRGHFGAETKILKNGMIQIL
jgi:hypothetical protein